MRDEPALNPPTGSLNTAFSCWASRMGNSHQFWIETDDVCRPLVSATSSRQIDFLLPSADGPLVKQLLVLTVSSAFRHDRKMFGASAAGGFLAVATPVLLNTRAATP